MLYEVITGKVLRLDLVTLDPLGRFQVDGVQVQALGARDQRHGQLQILTQLGRGPGLARIVAGGLDTAGQCTGAGLETGDIRITSYNVCYTKLLRRHKQAENRLKESISGPFLSLQSLV